jgi:DNA-binding MarR family transcriptional regulator
MAKRDRKKKSAVAAEAWREIFDFIVATGGHRNAVLARLGLTPNDSRALASLDARTGRTMRELARQWECDASTATWIVDRLETKGLAERHAHETDRRVKLVVLTERGESTKAEMITGTYAPPPELMTLTDSQLVVLRDAAAPLRDAVRREPSRKP